MQDLGHAVIVSERYYGPFWIFNLKSHPKKIKLSLQPEKRRF